MEQRKGGSRLRQTTTGAQLRRQKEERGIVGGGAPGIGFTQYNFNRNLTQYQTSQVGNLLVGNIKPLVREMGTTSGEAEAQSGIEEGRRKEGRGRGGDWKW